MTGSKTFLAMGVLVFAHIASAHEYPLQFTPNAGARGLVVTGYAFNGDTVIGSCSYYTVHSGSGRGGGYKTITTYYNQTCTWDLYGNLLSFALGTPTAPTPLYTNGTQTVYASNVTGETTGTDSALLPNHGFVNTPSSHYTWTTSNAYTVLQQVVYNIAVTLQSDGDVPVNISAVQVTARTAKATLKSTNCIGQIAVGATCSVTVTYDPTRLSSSTGLAYDTLDIGVVSDAGQPYDFVQSYTITVKKPKDDD